MKTGRDASAFASTEETIAIGQEKAERYARQLRAAVTGATGEEDIRLGVHHFLVDLTKELGVNVKVQAERVVITGGRIDSLFDLDSEVIYLLH